MNKYINLVAKFHNVSSRLDTRKVLFGLGLVASPITSRELSEFWGVNLRDLSSILRRLSRKGYIVRRRRMYLLTDKGLSMVRRKLYFRIHRIIHGGRKLRKLRFFKRKGEYTGIEVGSLKELVEVIRIISPDSLKYHVEKHDLQRWIKEELGDEYLYFIIENKLVDIGEAYDLREYLYEVLSNRLNNLMVLEKKLLGMRGQHNT